jgi:hypothetical protein
MGAHMISQLDAQAMTAICENRYMTGIDSNPDVTPQQLEAKMAQTLKRQAFLDLGRWIDSLRRWDIFVTCTFRPIVRRESNARGFARLELALKNYARLPLFKDQEKLLYSLRARDFELRLASRTPSEGYVRAFFNRFRSKLRRDLGTPISYWTGFEAGPISGQNHFHSLLGARSLRELRRTELWDWLHRHSGRSLVLPFERERGAGWYLALAYVGKRPLGWDCHVHGRSRLTRTPAKCSGGHEVVLSADMARPFFHATCPRWHR